MLSLLVAVSYFSVAIDIRAHTCQDTLRPSERVRSLPEVVIKKHPPHYSINGDTVSYSLSSHLRPGMFTLEDLVKGLPGFRVDHEGKITFNGKSISRILVDGEDLLEDRYPLISRNLRAALLNKIQVIQHHQSQRLLKDVAASNDIALNLSFREDAKGKLNGSVTRENGLKGLSQTNTAWVRIGSSSKQILFADCNNIGKLSVTGGESSTGSFEKARYHSGPMSFDPPSPAGALPSAYTLQNNDKAAAAAFSYSVNKSIRIRVNPEVLSLYENRSVSQQQKFYIAGDSMIGINHSSNTHFNRSTKGSGFSIHMDKGGSITSDMHLKGSSSLIRSTFFDVRSAMRDIAVQVEGQDADSYLEYRHGVIKKINNRKVLRVENEFYFHKQNRTAGYDTYRTDSLVLSTFTNTGKLNHRGILASSQLLINQSLRNWKLGYGVKNSFEKIRSYAHSESMHVDLYKSYAFMHASRSLSKKWIHEMQAASGVLRQDIQDQHHRHTPIFFIDQSIAFKPKAIERYAVGFNLGKKAMDLSLLFSGPFLDQQGKMVMGLDSVGFPIAASFNLDMMRMDLYRGLTISLNGKFTQVQQQPMLAGYSSNLNDATRYFISGGERNYFFMGQFEKIIHVLGLSYKFTTSSRFQRVPQLFNDIPQQLHFTHLQYYQNITSRWQHTLNVVCFQSINSVQVHAAPSQTHFTRRVVNAQSGIRLLFTPSQKIFGELSFFRIRYDRLQSLLVCDAYLKLQPTSKYSISIAMHNFFDEKAMTEKLLGPFGISTLEWVLSGRRLLLGLQWKM